MEIWGRGWAGGITKMATQVVLVFTPLLHSPSEDEQLTPVQEQDTDERILEPGSEAKEVPAPQRPRRT